MKKKFLFSLLLCLFIPSEYSIYAQNEAGSGVIFIFTNPGGVNVKIPELKFQEDKLGKRDIILYNVPEGKYRFKFSGGKEVLQNKYFLSANDTLTVFANFRNNILIGVSIKNLSDSEEELKLRDYVMASFEISEKPDISETNGSDSLIIIGLNNTEKVFDEDLLNEKIAANEAARKQKVEIVHDNEKEHYIVEEMPLFNGGDPAREFRKFIAMNLRYPNEAAAKGIRGKVIVSFAINSLGEVTDIKVIRSIHPLLDAEAIRVISASPKWSPGRQGGEAVKVIVNFPINFHLFTETIIPNNRR